MWPEFRFSHKGNAGADKDHVGGIICSYHISAVNNDIDRGIKRLTRTQKQTLEAAGNYFLCTFTNLEINF